MNLLEKHHETFAQLLKFQTSNPQSSEAIPSEPKISAQALASSTLEKSRETSPFRPPLPNPVSSHLPQREVSSSIASNLASARGIPSSRQRKSSPASATVHLYPDNKTSSAPVKSRPGKPVLVPPRAAPPENPQGRRKIFSSPHLPTAGTPKPSTSQAPNNPKTTDVSTNPRSEEPFQRFYATFESIFSKLSAPLAFAGLPLNVEEPAISLAPSSLGHTKSEEQRPPTTDPDFSKIFSKAALRALRDEHGGPVAGSPFNGAESFYVVPTTGGTISYAEILARAQQDAIRHNINSSTEAADYGNYDEQIEDEFVDARETLHPASPVSSRRPKPGTKTMEELQLENEALRALADNVCRRLLEFEMGAQTSSLALQRSIRAMQGPAVSPSGPAESIGAGGDVNGDKIAKLEEQVAELKREAERMGKENEKLKSVVGRYRERWEKLKEGAKLRREGTGDGGG